MDFWGNRVRLAGLTLVVFLAGAWQTPPPEKSSTPNAAEINAVLKELSDITGFRIRRELPFELITKAQVNTYVKDQIKRSVKPDEIRAQETTLKKLGFVPPEFDLKQTTIDLLTEQAAAFYDFRRKKLFISDWAAVNMRDSAVIHELAHALADQNFSIQKFLGKSDDDSEASGGAWKRWWRDRLSADAGGVTCAAMEDRHYLEGRGRGYDLDPGSSDSQYPVFNNAPLYLKRTMLFPYDAGEKFQQAVFLRHDGKKFVCKGL